MVTTASASLNKKSFFQKCVYICVLILLLNMLRSGDRSLLSTKEVAFVDEESSIPKTLKFATPSSRQRASTASTYQHRESTSSAFGLSAGTSDVKNSRASSASFESVQPSRHKVAEESRELKISDLGIFPESESTIQVCSFAKVTNQVARPQGCGYHESFMFNNGDRYEGEWRFGTLSGEGTYFKADGKEFFSGHFENDTLNGLGKHRERDGNTYEGGYKNGLRHGRGKFSRPGGETFECEWRDGVMRGKASIIYYYMFDHKTGGKLEGSDAFLPGYTNTLNQDVPSYPRTEACRRFDISASGRRYDFDERRGGFSPYLQPVFRAHSPRTAAFLSKDCFVYKHEADLRGKLVNHDEEVYEGGQKQCPDGMYRRYGKGTLRWGIGLKEVYTGDWLYNKKHGTGERVWSSGECYNGTWNHDLMEGKGSYRWPDGSKYNGEFMQGGRSGIGTQTWKEKNGDIMVYEGAWMRDRRNGVGTLSCADGRSYSGDWLDGRIMGHGFLKYCNGYTYEGEFHEGMKHGEGVRTELQGNNRILFKVLYQYNLLTRKERIDSDALDKPAPVQGLKAKKAAKFDLLIDLETNGTRSEDTPLPASWPEPPPLSPTDNAAVQQSDGSLLVQQYLLPQSDEGGGQAENISAAYTSNWTLGERW